MLNGDTLRDCGSRGGLIEIIACVKSKVNGRKSHWSQD